VDGHHVGTVERGAQPQLKKKRRKAMMLKTQMFIHNLMTKLTNPLANKEGATAVEYGLMVALIAVVIIGMVTLLGTALRDKFEIVKDAVAGA
jgi:pilus assembly protein Flp/PilA